MSVLSDIVDARTGGTLPALSVPTNRIDALTEAVLARLKALLPPSVHVERFPDRPEKFDMQGRDAAVLVIVTAGSFAKAATPGRAALYETMTIVVPVLVRSLEGATGAPALLEDVRLALQGVCLAGGTAIQPLSRALVDQDEGVFRFDFEFETTLPAVAASLHPLMRAS